MYQQNMTKVIQQADEALESSLLNPNSNRVLPAGDVIKAIKTLQRQVSKIVFHCKGNALPESRSKFNTYGRYRWEERDKQLQISTPQVVEVSKSEVAKPSPKKDTFTHANDSLYVHPSEQKHPSTHYRILFDTKSRFTRKKQSPSSIRSTNYAFKKNHTLNKTNGFLKGKINEGDQLGMSWILGRKVAALEKQIKQLKQKNSNPGHKIKMKNIEQIVEWL